MADKVVRLKTLTFMETTMSGDDVVLLLTGKGDGGRVVRTEAALHTYAIIDLIDKMRKSVDCQVEKWARVKRALGTG